MRVRTVRNQEKDQHAPRIPSRLRKESGKWNHESSEISSLRAAVADLDRKNDELRKENYHLLLDKIACYERKEQEQLKEDNKALREKLALYERKEKEQQDKEDWASRCDDEPDTTHALESIRTDAEDAHHSPPRNVKRARHDDDESTCVNSQEGDDTTFHWRCDRYEHEHVGQ
jgi:hypothetical protein